MKAGATVIYSPDYDIHFMGLERLHPFDSRKYSRAWNEVHAALGPILERHTVAPPRRLGRSEMEAVHTADYLDQLESPPYVLRALEVGTLPVPPPLLAWVLRERVLGPMALASMGTIMAAESALEGRPAINLSGGYHHAGSDRGEGFCIYADVALALTVLRRNGSLASGDRIAVIDLDAHQGNGVERIFAGDPNVSILDMYNADIYPQDRVAEKAISRPVRLRSGAADREYLGRLQETLPEFLDQVAPRLAVYNAGTDIYEGDSLGRLRVSADGVLARDQFVVEQLTARDVPWFMVLSGGYSAESYRLIARSVRWVLELDQESD